MKRIFDPINVFLMIALVGISIWKEGGLAAGIGYALGIFALPGVLIGFLLLGLYQFARNAANPNNGFKPEFKDRITASLAGGILAMLII